MSLLMDMSGYLRRYGSATLEELARHFQTADDTIETAADVLRQKGRVARRRVLPQCTSGSAAREAAARTAADRRAHTRAAGAP